MSSAARSTGPGIAPAGESTGPEVAPARAIARPEVAGASPGVPRARVALGRAFAARVGDCTRLIEELEVAAGLQERSEPLAARRSHTRNMASRMIARWLITDKRSSLAEVTFVSELGQLAVGEGIPLTDITRTYMMWRDANLRVMSEEIARLNSPADIAEVALAAIRV